jgi:hypothetical protein
MTVPNVPEDDPVEDLLRMDGPKGADLLRARLLARTTSAVRRRRCLRRVAVVAALAGCYLAGMATTLACRSLSAPSAASVVEPRTPENQRGERGERRGPVRDTPQCPRTEHDPRAHGSDAQHGVAGTEFDAIRRAGDRFFVEQGDVLRALDCYARALDRASPEELAISADEDNWLLMALKLERIEENRNVDRGT